MGGESYWRQPPSAQRKKYSDGWIDELAFVNFDDMGVYCRQHGLAIERLGSTTWFFDDIDFDDLDIF
jgi:hypothetical protein